MEEAYETQLQLIENHLNSQLSSATNVLSNIDNGGVELQDIILLKTRIRQTAARYATALDAYISRCTKPSTEIITSSTDKQMAADEMLAKLEVITHMSETQKTCPPAPVHHSKLPTLPPPRFSGDVLDYNEFWDKFQSTIGRRNLEEVDKLSYLIAAVDGKAKEALSGLSISSANYQIAVDTLKRQFGSKDAQIDAHYEALKQLPAAQNSKGCRQTLNSVEHHLRVLQTLGENTDGNHLRTTITSKFPNQIMYEVNMTLSEEENTVPHIRKGLERVIMAFERANPLMEHPTLTPCVTYGSGSDTTTTQALLQPEGKGRGPHKALLGKRRRQEENQWTKSNKLRRKSCIFCDGAHYNSDCTNFISLESRREKLGDRCYRCLKGGHRSNACSLKGLKKCYYCREDHHQALCPNRNKGEKMKKSNYSVTSNLFLNSTSFLQTATVKIASASKERNCRLLLDSGSQRSYMTAQMAKELKVVADKEDLLIIYTFGSEHPSETPSSSAKIDIVTKRGICRTIRVNIVPHITDRIPVPEIRANSTIDVVADDDSVGERVDLLIGSDLYMSFMRNKTVKVQDHLFLIDTDFGWILTGKIDSSTEKENTLSVITYCHCQDPEQVYFTEPDLPLRDRDVNFLWTLESIGITDSAKTTREEEVVKHFTETVNYDNCRYHVKWPWTEYPPDLPTNLGVAYGRLKGLVRRLDRSTLKEYNTILQEQLNANIIEVIDPQPVTVTQRTPPVHYLPHHLVKHEGKKARIVYDASARVKEQRSLNECMYRGPSMLEDITKLIIKFRTNSVGITADVEKAFLQVGLQEADRDVTRFLWLKDTEKEASEDNILHLRFCRVPFGIISSPFLLTATIRHHLSTKGQELLTKIADRVYVDNLVTTASSGQSAYNLYLETRKAFNELSMNIRDWASNDRDFIEKIPKEHRAKETESVKILGLTWTLKDDSLQLKLNDKVFNEESSKNTKNKRDVLKILASFYDPCGFASPIVLPAKILLQELWKRKLKWDTPLPEDMKTKWQAIAEALQTAKDIKVPRYLGNEKSMKGGAEHELHCYTDASSVAHAAVVYLRVITKQGSKTVFIMSKSRVNPLTEKEDLKIPRLELLGYVIGSRLLSYVKNALDIPIRKQYLWTDSLIVLSWMKSTKLLPPFITRRVNEIKQNRDVEMCYINTEQNPADLATRPELWSQKRELWFNGPPFLSKEKTAWPIDMNLKHHHTTLSAMAEGLDTEGPESTEGSKSTETSRTCETDEVLDEQTQTNHNVQDTSVQKNPLSSQLLEIKNLQSTYFKEEAMGKETHLSRNLGLFVDVDGILRCKGRVTHTDWSYEMKHPILLPKDCEFTSKVISEVHVKNYHVGVSHTLSLVRQQYWIPQGRSQVQKILKRCPQCVKHGGGPYELPPTPDLPPERVTFSPAFTYTGMDYFGPMYVTTEQGKEKRWICLYTCLVVRAIHLEVVKNLTAEECLLSLRRFVATRGTPSLMVSDNALQFRLTSEVVAKPYCSKNNIKWKFIPQLAPWHGGVYERLVAVVKHCLKRTLEKHLLGESQLVTVIKEVESVCNTRPLTYVNSEVEHILKPADFLSLGKCLTLDVSPEQMLPEGTVLKQNLIEGWKRGQRIMTEFKEMFVGQYLTSLRERYRHSQKQPRVRSRRTPCIGDIVQIKGELKNREGWKVGKISSLIQGPDGECKVAKVLVGDSEFTRSVGHLYPLEADIIADEEGGNEEPKRAPAIETRHSDISELLSIPIGTEEDEAAPTATSEMTPENPCYIEDERKASQSQSEMMEVDDNENNTTQNNETNFDHSDKELTEERNHIDVRVQRAAAIRAKEKNAKWTRLLFTLLK